MIKVSVIMPSLNVKKYIEEAVKSALNQTLQEIEIICVDGGSSDGTFEILQKLSQSDPRVILLQTSVKSYGFQMNLGIRAARGEYIAVLETDDFVDDKMYERLYLVAKQNDCDYVKSDYMAYWTQDNGDKVFLNRKTFLDDKLYNRVIRPKSYAEIATDDWYLWTGIYKKAFLQKNNIKFSETRGAAFQDIGFLIKTTQAAEKAIYIKDSFYRYCIDREESSSNSGNGLKYCYYEYKELLGHDIQWEDKDNLRFIYGRMVKSLICSYPKDSINKESTSEFRKYYEWFKAQLLEAIDHDVISSKTVHSALWEKLLLLLIDEEQYLKKAKKKKQDYLDKIGQETQQHPIVVFGCGNIGYGVYKWLVKEGRKIDSFMDNNSALWDTSINGIKIQSPAAAVTMPLDTVFFIANEKYALDICSQLESMGIEKARICIFE